MSKELKPVHFAGKHRFMLLLPMGKMTALIVDVEKVNAFLDDGRLDQWNCRPIEDAQAVRIEALEAENGRLREALKEIAEFANDEYGKRIPAPSCVEFLTIKRYAEKALKGAGE